MYVHGMHFTRAIRSKLKTRQPAYSADMWWLVLNRCLQVLLLDADSMPLVEPELLFKVPLFQCVLFC